MRLMTEAAGESGSSRSPRQPELATFVAGLLGELDEVRRVALGVASLTDDDLVERLAESVERLANQVRLLVTGLVVPGLHATARPQVTVGPVHGQAKQLPGWARELSDAMQRWLLELPQEVLSSPHLRTAYLEVQGQAVTELTREGLRARVMQLTDEAARRGEAAS